MIRPLDSASIRQLCAGQVLSSVAGVVKELLENSLDAGATVVTVDLCRFGISKIVVTDDGHGVSLDSTAPCVLLAQRASSKRQPCHDESASSLHRSSDLGFRGEALHSLAQLSQLEIESRGVDALESYVVRYHTASATSVVERGARDTHGTVVRVVDLFHGYPVRRQELERTKKRQLADTVALVKQYALTRAEVRIILQHEPEPGDAKVTLCSTTGSGDVQRALGEAYGGRVMTSMVPVHWELRSCAVSGFLSKKDAGRASGDLQIFSLDGRLVDLPRCAKAIQDAFREYLPNAESRTFPAFFLSLQTRANTRYDVNLAPDKRKVLIEREVELIDELRREAVGMFRLSSDSVELPRDRLSGSGGGSVLKRADDRRAPIVALTPNHSNHTGGSVGGPLLLSVSSSSASRSSLRKRDREDDDEEGKAVEGDAKSRMDGWGNFDRRSSSLATSATGANGGDAGSDCAPSPRGNGSCCCANAASRRLSLDTTVGETSDKNEKLLFVATGDALGGSVLREQPTVHDQDGQERKHHPRQDDESVPQSDGALSSSPTAPAPATAASECFADSETLLLTDEGVDYRHMRRRNSCEVAFPCLEYLARTELPPLGAPATLGAEEAVDKDETKHRAKKKKAPRPLAAQTEADLRAVLHKASFANMVIHGQFNHGFLVTSLDDDLYIIDQHASDEKYNYEQLISKYVAKPQPLVKPVSVAMEAVEAELALEHKQELRSHGFLVQPCTGPGVSSSGGAAINVLSVPVLPYDNVAPQDICELTQQLVQYGKIVKGLRAVWHSMATKACRSSIMIGAILTDQKMRDIVTHLSTLDQPWNCPHGRPTLRHLGFLSSLKGS